MLDRRRDQDVERQEERARPPQPAPALQFGTLGWASAMGNQAVARLARQPVEEELSAEAEAEQSVEEESEFGDEAEAEMIPDDLPDELPE